MHRYLNGLRTTIWRFRVAVQAVIVSLLSYSTALITTYVENIGPTNDKIVIISGGLIVVVVMTLVSSLVDKIIREREKAHQREHNIHKSGYVTLNREINNYIQILREFEGAGVANKFRVLTDLMKNAVQQLYETLEAEYGTAVSVEDHVEFEVTFMTMSIKDGKITIAAWANRDGRAPKSLAKRDKNPEIYSETETAKLYDDENRTVRIIPTTSDSDYKELYPGQKQRIRSSIIYPVIDDTSALLDTLVVHCDRNNFFCVKDAKLWRELLEPYTKRLALARFAVDRLIGEHPKQQPF